MIAAHTVLCDMEVFLDKAVSNVPNIYNSSVVLVQPSTVLIMYQFRHIRAIGMERQHLPACDVNW